MCGTEMGCAWYQWCSTSRASLSSAAAPTVSPPAFVTLSLWSSHVPHLRCHVTLLLCHVTLCSKSRHSRGPTSHDRDLANALSTSRFALLCESGIGSSVEFDYGSVLCLRALIEMGKKTVSC